MRYIIKQTFCDEESYYTNSKYGDLFRESQDSAYQYKRRCDAERAVNRILKEMPSLGVLDIVPVQGAVCTFDCFHCPFPDCRNGNAKQTKWERQALSVAQLEV